MGLMGPPPPALPPWDSQLYTYFPPMSHSRLTNPPPRRPPRFVPSSVRGMSSTSKVDGPSEATVRLTPSTATDPLGTRKGRRAVGKETVSLFPGGREVALRTFPTPPTWPLTRCPLSGEARVRGSSRLSQPPGLMPPRVVLSIVSRERLKRSSPRSAATRLRQTPFTAS